MNKRMVLLSIKDKYAKQILIGQKKFEYRRVPPKLKPPFVLVLKTKDKIVGSCVVKDVISLPLRELISRTISETPHSPDHIMSYFDGKETGTALEIGEPQSLEENIDIPYQNIQNFIYIDPPPSKTGWLWDSFKSRIGHILEPKQLDLFYDFQGT
jgi:predicted transcriptional regulator